MVEIGSALGSKARYRNSTITSQTWYKSMSERISEVITMCCSGFRQILNT